MTCSAPGREGRKAENGLGEQGAGVRRNDEDHLCKAGLQIRDVLQKKLSQPGAGGLVGWEPDTFQDDGKCLCLDRCGSYMSVYFCQNSSNHTL